MIDDTYSPCVSRDAIRGTTIRSSTTKMPIIMAERPNSGCSRPTTLVCASLLSNESDNVVNDSNSRTIRQRCQVFAIKIPQRRLTKRYLISTAYKKTSKNGGKLIQKSPFRAARAGTTRSAPARSHQGTRGRDGSLRSSKGFAALNAPTKNPKIKDLGAQMIVNLPLFIGDLIAT